MERIQEFSGRQNLKIVVSPSERGGNSVNMAQSGFLLNDVFWMRNTEVDQLSCLHISLTSYVSHVDF